MAARGAHRLHVSKLLSNPLPDEIALERFALTDLGGGCLFLCSRELGTRTSFFFDPRHCTHQRSPHFTLASLVPIEAPQFVSRDCFGEGRCLVFFGHGDHTLQKMSYRDGWQRYIRSMALSGFCRLIADASGGRLV